MPEIERCWLCHKICERPWNPPDIAPEDMCRCNEPEEESVGDQIEQGFSELKDILRETLRGTN